MISIIVITLTLNLRKTYRRKSGSGEAGHATPTAGSA
jgi:hypothetical protein